MISRRFAARRASRAGSEDEPKRHRVWLFTLLTIGAGAVAAIAAMVGPVLFAGLQTLANNLMHPNAPQPQIEARTLFPPVPPVHKVIDVYDPPPPAPAPAPQPAPKPPVTAPTPTPRPPHASPSPTPTHSSPTPTPHGGD